MILSLLACSSEATPESPDIESQIDDYTKAIELEPNNGKAYNNRGASYYNLGEYEKAIDDYSKAIELDPNYTNVYYNRGDSYYNLGEHEKAIDDYTKAIDLDPNN